MALDDEKHLEVEICDWLANHGWLYDDELSSQSRALDAGYDKERALFPQDLYGWLYDTQPEQLAKLVRPGAGTPADPVANVLGEYASAAPRILDRLVKVLATDPRNGGGTLNVLRKGLDVTPAKLTLFQPRPLVGGNETTATWYAANRLRVVRQVHYSTKNQKSIDLVLFLNGLPVATIELKTDFKQSLEVGLGQYRTDRQPAGEPLLTFGRGALVHFVVTEEWVRMTTRLESANTTFLPFDRGRDNGEGNPLMAGTAATAYLWRETLEPAIWLDILARFVHYRFEEKTGADGKRYTASSLRFPRYHQWRVVMKLEAAALAEGPGHNYLVQHSAGSGKTDSIAWTAHRLNTLHRDDGSKVFDAVIVVSDRRVLDGQLRAAVDQLASKAGVFKAISEREPGSKSQQLADALASGQQIIGVTLQTFPYALEVLKTSPALASRSFAVVADEAHSSQSGDAAKRLREVLGGTAAVANPDDPDDPDDPDTPGLDTEDALASAMAARVSSAISFLAFTATPKGKTLELFGRPGPSGKPEPFDLYSMKQAIEEHFILDVLQNYMTYDLAFKLATKTEAGGRVKVDTGKASGEVMRWVRLHPHNIAQKVAVIVAHFVNTVADGLGGQAKAMVVTGSRKEAVRYKLAIDKYLVEHGLADRYSTLVAFSGAVKDTESGPDDFTEASMNPRSKGRRLENAFATDEFQMMIVANKYQTGFDQPLLVAMYVDKRLDGIAAVQTLSRLNRVIPGKVNTYVLDFVNAADDILKAFQTYYEDAQLMEPSDPDVVHDMLAKIEAAGIIDVADIDPVVEEMLKPHGQHTRLSAFVKTSRDRFYDRWRTARTSGDKGEQETCTDFRKTINDFVRTYDFLSQIVDYGNVEIEKWSIFLKVYRGAIAADDGGDEPIDVSQLVLTHYGLIGRAAQDLRLRDGEPGKLKGITGVGSTTPRHPHEDELQKVLQAINDLFAGSNIAQIDQVNAFESISRLATASRTLQAEAMANSERDFARSPSIIDELEDIPFRADQGHGQAMKFILQSGRYRELAEALLELGLYQRLRDAAQHGIGAND